MKIYILIRNFFWRYSYCIGILVLGVLLSSCGCSAKNTDESQVKHAAATDNPASAKTVDFEGYPFGPEWVLELAENDREWATHLVDRAITAYKAGQLEVEIVYLNKIMKSLNIVQIEGSFTDYREPLFIKTDYGTALARRLSDSGLDIRPSRHTPWNYKDGLVSGLICILEYAVKTENLGK